MSDLWQGSSRIRELLLTTPAGQAVCLLRSGLARIHFRSSAKQSAQFEPDFEHQSTFHTLTKEPSVAISERDDASMEQSQMDSTLFKLAQDWPMAKRVYTFVVICVYTFTVYAGSSVYIAGVPEIMHQFHVSQQEAMLGLSLYVFFYGIGPLLWAPLSEVKEIGRSPVYAITFAAFFCFSILAATAQTWPAFLIFRCLQAFFGSPCLANGGASMHDLFPDLTVAYSLAIWIAAAYCGPALGPLMAGYVVPIKGWRWAMWEIVWLSAPVIVLLWLLPETHAPTITARNQHRANKNLEQTATSDRTSSTAMALSIKNALVKPIQICIQDPAVAVANIYTSFIYSTYYTFFDAVPRVYTYNYGFTPGQVGLVFLSVFVACIVAGSAYCLYISKVLHPKLKSGSWAAYESQLRPALAATFLLPLGLFLFGWTSDGTIHWIVSVVGIALYSMGTFIILQCLSVYLPKIYPRYSASLFAANDFCRSTLAAAAIHFAIPLYDDLGIGRGVSVLGGLSILGTIGMWYIYRAGESLRARSRFTDFGE